MILTKKEQKWLGKRLHSKDCVQCALVRRLLEADKS